MNHPWIAKSWKHPLKIFEINHKAQNNQRTFLTAPINRGQPVRAPKRHTFPNYNNKNNFINGTCIAETSSRNKTDIGCMEYPGFGGTFVPQLWDLGALRLTAINPSHVTGWARSPKDKMDEKGHNLTQSCCGRFMPIQNKSGDCE